MSDIPHGFPLFPILVGALSVAAGAATVGCSSSNAAAPTRGDAGGLDESPDAGACVGTLENDDTPSFCASTSYAISAGPVLEMVDPVDGTTTWSVWGQACDMAALDQGACAHDAGAD